MGRAKRKGGTATLRPAEGPLDGLRYEGLALREEGVVQEEGADSFLLDSKTEAIERRDWGDASAITYQYQGELGTLFFVAGEPIYASPPGGREIRSLRDSDVLGRIPPLRSAEEISREAAEQAEEEIAHLGGSHRQKMVLESKYTGQGRAAAFQEQKRAALRLLRRAL